jgi:GNAT superfamily N-acetyltransferase
MLRREFPDEQCRKMTAASNAFKIEVRPAEARDAVAIARLAGELGYPSTAALVRVRLAAVREDPRHATFIAASTGDEVIGWIHLSESHSPGSDPRAEIANLVVDSRFRSAGTGRVLVQRGEEWARERGLGVIGVHSNIIRERAHAFYLRLGYTVAKSQKVFRKTL